MSAARYILRYQGERGTSKERTLDKKEILIGRLPNCDIVLGDQEVAHVHARLSLEPDGIFLTDLGSTSGTWRDGVRIPDQQRTALSLGQAFSIAGTAFFLEEAAAEEAPSLPGLMPASPGFQLFLQRGDAPVWEVPFNAPELVLGRAPDCGLVLDDREISRHHARLQAGPDGLWLVDLGSTNGTQVDGHPLLPRKPTLLHPGQTIGLGPFCLKIQEAGGPPAAPAAMLPGDLSKTMLAPVTPRELTAPIRLDLAGRERAAIGRAPDNDLVLDHPVVSAYHAVLERLGTRLRLRDLRSTNGVLVNGERIQGESWLTESDAIQIGPYLLTLAGGALRAQAEDGLRLEARGLHQRVSRQVDLLQDISLTIQPMELVAIVGMSGSGKTTLLNALSGFRPGSDGQVLVNGVDLVRYYDEFRHDLGYVPQKDIVHTELTPLTALEYVARLRMPPDITPQERRSAVLAVLEELDLLERKDDPIARLSGGQLKRVSIGVELLTRPRLFFLDEPTSGLDPGMEYEMMALMRRLADQGRTVILVTHATKNISFCDKVVFLARGGNLAFYGPPEEALRYFDAFRTEREQRQKEMEFDDIYRILEDGKRSNPEDWARRYRESPPYGLYCVTATGQAETRMGGPALQAARQARKTLPVRGSSLRQFAILSERNLRILVQDRVSLILMLAMAPFLGALDFIWGTQLYDPVKGDASKVVTMWFMLTLIAFMVGALSSVREIVKEAEIYRRERAVNLQVLPYILSKIWVGIVLAAYQGAVLLLLRVLLVHLKLPVALDYLDLFVTLFLGILSGYLVGLFVSSVSPNQNAAILLIILAVIPQFMFAGALLPLDLIPGGEAVSVIMPSRWIFEAFLRIAGPGEELTTDPCWQVPKSQRSLLTDVQKEKCACMGANIFTRCTSFPGILSPDYYTLPSASALSQTEPSPPSQPGSYPTPTAYPSPTPLPSPTPAAAPAWLGARAIQATAVAQMGAYASQARNQQDAYATQVAEQNGEYLLLAQVQGQQYQEAMQTYGDTLSQWQEGREKAINSAEAILGAYYDSYGRAMRGTAWERWLALLGIMTGMTVLIFFLQRRKDLV
jgi:ABC-type multidrug transport system ATPase subunit/pSer/pThr/pTyr-binding forkhead associated (FHA) protein